MTINRRTFFKLGLLSYLSVFVSRISFAKPETVFSSVFPAFLDTIIPADQTPSATQLNVDKDIVQDLNQNQRYMNICLLGCLWLDKKAVEKYKSSFGNINLIQRSEIVTELENQKQNQTTQFFFYLIRNKAFDYYYSKPQSWQGIGIDQTPQPLGYPDYDQAITNS